MFEISIPQIKNCIKDFEEQEKQYSNLIKRMEAVCSDFEGLAPDKSDKKALQAYLEQMQGDLRNISTLRQTLSEIVHCYEGTERKLIGSDVLPGVQNQFGMLDLSQMENMLESLSIVFK